MNRKIAIFTNIEKTEQVPVMKWWLLREGMVASGEIVAHKPFKICTAPSS